MLLTIQPYRVVSRVATSTLTVRRALATAAATTAAASKPSLASMVKRLRQDTQAPMTRARAAAEKFPNDYDSALNWLQEELGRVGREKASKLAERVTSEGLVAVLAGPGARGVLVEMACETDFVAKNSVFRKLADQAAITAMLAGDFPSNATPCSYSRISTVGAPLLELPENAPSIDPTMAPKTVNEGILDAISKLGEKIALRRAVIMDGEAVDSPQIMRRVVGYAHGGSDAAAGRIASLVLVEAEATEANTSVITAPGFGTALTLLGRDLARQVVGFAPTMIDVPANETSEEAAGTALLRQPSL
ncbi:elongation factor TS-domain-containing protein, partial [Syncephalis fuscata]